MSPMTDPHCPTCGTVAEAFGVECECPCHSWKDRDCRNCGGIRIPATFQFLKGDLTVSKARCNECGMVWEAAMNQFTPELEQRIRVDLQVSRQNGVWPYQNYEAREFMTIMLSEIDHLRDLLDAKNADEDVR